MAAAIAVLAALFGTGPLHLPGTIENVQSKGNWQSVPGFISTRLGLGAVGGPVTLILSALFAGAVGWLLWRVWHGRLDWIVGAGWAAVALLVTAASLLPGTRPATATSGAWRRPPLIGRRSESPW